MKISVTLEDAARQLREVKNEKEQVAAIKKDLDAREEYLESLLLAGLRAEGLSKASTPSGTVSIKTEDIPTIESWPMAIEYIVEQKLFMLLKKSISSAVWRELKEQGMEVPGIGTFTKESIQFRRK